MNAVELNFQNKLWKIRVTNLYFVMEFNERKRCLHKKLKLLPLPILGYLFVVKWVLVVCKDKHFRRENNWRALSYNFVGPWDYIFLALYLKGPFLSPFPSFRVTLEARGGSIDRHHGFRPIINRHSATRQKFETDVIELGWCLIRVYWKRDQN